MKDIKQSSSLDSQQKWSTKIIHQSLLMVLEGIKILWGWKITHQALTGKFLLSLIDTCHSIWVSLSLSPSKNVLLYQTQTGDSCSEIKRLEMLTFESKLSNSWPTHGTFSWIYQIYFSDHKSVAKVVSYSVRCSATNKNAYDQTGNRKINESLIHINEITLYKLKNM